MTSSKKLLNTLHIFLMMFILTGVILDQWGVVLNATVVIANDGQMPVAQEENMILGVNPGFARKISDGSERFLFLSDRFLYDFPEIETSLEKMPFSSPVRWWVKKLNYPAEGGYSSFSIGDVMRWFGTVIFLLSLPLLIISIVSRFVTGDLPRPNPLDWFKAPR